MKLPVRWRAPCLALCAALLLPAQKARAGEIEVIAASKPSVVAVGTFRALDNPRFTFRGTGFVVGDGRQIVTNAHVLPEAMPDGAKLVVQVDQGGGNFEWRDARADSVVRPHDLALLRIDGNPLPALPLAPPQPAREGQAVLFIGYPIGGLLGFRPVSHRGMVASLTPIAAPAPNSRQLNAQAIATLRRGSFDIIQLDATAYPGNSGGPLLDVASGQVVGVVNMVLVKGNKESALSQPSGISYALPVQLVHELLRERP